MYKKIIAILFAVIVLLAGISNTKQGNGDLNLEYEKLTEKEQYLLNVTGNKVAMYKLNGLPTDKKYEINWIYEVYKNGEKVKEEIITGIYKDEINNESKDKTLVLNYQEDKINSLLGEDGGFSSKSLDIENNVEYSGVIWLTNDITIELGTEIYLYHATTGRKTNDKVVHEHITLGTPRSKKDIDEIVNSSEENVFIKMVYNEVK